MVIYRGGSVARSVAVVLIARVAWIVLIVSVVRIVLVASVARDFESQIVNPLTLVNKSIHAKGVPVGSVALQG